MYQKAAAEFEQGKQLVRQNCFTALMWYCDASELSGFVSREGAECGTGPALVCNQSRFILWPPASCGAALRLDANHVNAAKYMKVSTAKCDEQRLAKQRAEQEQQRRRDEEVARKQKLQDAAKEQAEAKHQLAQCKCNLNPSPPLCACFWQRRRLRTY